MLRYLKKGIERGRIAEEQREERDCIAERILSATVGHTLCLVQA